MIMVANHGFLYLNKVYHPTEENSVCIEKIVNKHLEYDVTFINLTPFSNSLIFGTLAYLELTKF